jgi:plasmid stabilization system protein ParE
MPVVNVIISPAARDDLVEINRQYVLTQDNSKLADKILGEIYHHISLLEHNPNYGAPLDSRISTSTSYRYIVCGGYLIFHRPEGDAEAVVRILDARTGFVNQLFKDEI